MAAVADWSVPCQLITPKGTLLLNQHDAAAGGTWLLDKDGCKTRRDPRITRTNRAQASGEVRHFPFSAGYQLDLKLSAWKDPDGEIACDALLQQMWDVLMLHANAIFFDDPILDFLLAGRFVWTPKGAAVDRMLNNIWTIQLPDEGTEPESVATLTCLTEYPYAWDAPETVTHVSEGSGGAVTLHNAGTASFYPVIKVNGPYTGGAFTLTNESALDANGDPLAIVYDSALPGAPTVAGGHYIELTHYRETAYVDGHVLNAKPGLNILACDFFPLIPGDNVIVIHGATADILWQNAWA